MTDKKITSYNQQGGITANTVQIGKLHQDNSSKKTEKKQPWYKNGWLITIIGGIVAAVVAGLILNNMNDQNSQVKVTSYNQQGGITANSVRIETPARHLNEQTKQGLAAHLPADKTKQVDVTSVMGDQEAYQFAQEIKEHLENEGYKVNGVNQSVFNKPVKGQIIEPTGDGSIKIIIGGRG